VARRVPAPRRRGSGGPGRRGRRRCWPPLAPGRRPRPPRRPPRPRRLGPLRRPRPRARSCGRSSRRSTVFGPGHRGVDLDHPVGGLGGRCRRRGRPPRRPRGGVVWVSLEHADGVLTSYGPLRTSPSPSGDVVGRGTARRLAPGGHGHEADADRGVHWGARRDGVYIDPLSLLSPRWRPSLVGPGGWWGTSLAVTPYAPWTGGRHGTACRSRRSPRRGPARVRGPAEREPPGPRPRARIRVRRPALRPVHLGYAPGDVTAHSYAGRAPDGEQPRRRVRRPVARAASVRAGGHLARGRGRLGAPARPAPRPVGGRARPARGPRGLLDGWGGHAALPDPPPRRRTTPTLPPIGHVVTLASPLQGSDVAALGSGP
jgi:hypothetical protein